MDVKKKRIRKKRKEKHETKRLSNEGKNPLYIFRSDLQNQGCLAAITEILGIILGVFLQNFRNFLGIFLKI